MNNNFTSINTIFLQKEIEKEIFQKKIETLTEQLNGQIFFGYEAHKEPYAQMKLSGEAFILCDLSTHIPTQLPFQKLVFSFKFETIVNITHYCDNENSYFKVIKPSKIKSFPRTEFVCHEELINRINKLPNLKIFSLSDFIDLKDVLNSILSKSLEQTLHFDFDKWRNFGIPKEYLNGLGKYPSDQKEMVILHESFIKHISKSFIDNFNKKNFDTLEDIIYHVNQEILQTNLNENLSNKKNNIKKLKI